MHKNNDIQRSKDGLKMNNLNKTSLTFSDFLKKEISGEKNTLHMVERIKKLMENLGDLRPNETFAKLRLLHNKNPNLIGSCSFQDVLLCLMQAAELGVQIGSNECVYIYRRAGRPVLHLGYQALIRIALSTNAIKHMRADVKYKDDEFYYKTNGSVYHMTKTRTAELYLDLSTSKKTREERIKTLVQFVDFPFCEIHFPNGIIQVDCMREWVEAALSSGAVFDSYPEAILKKFAIRRSMNSVLQSMPSTTEKAAKVIDVLNVEDGFKTQEDALLDYCSSTDLGEILEVIQTDEGKETKQNPYYKNNQQPPTNKGTFITF